jgi:cell division protein FtsB
MENVPPRPLLAYAVYALALALLVAGAYLCFELGRYESGYSVIDHRRDVAALRKDLREQQAAADELRRQIAVLETSREIDRETYARVEANLTELQGRIQSQEEELAFYRGIVSPKDGVAGLRIESLDVVPADEENRYSLRLVLVQAIVHNRRATGSVKVVLEGMRGGQTVSMDLTDLVVDRHAYDTTYEFRYFQGLETDFVVPAGFEPQRVTVEISPTEPRGDRSTQSFDWSPVTE